MDVEIDYDNWKFQTHYKPQNKFVHLDLKGAPPLIEYYAQIFPLIKKYGATGILVEYEDMFPYTGSIKDISRDDCYTEYEIEALLSLAKANGLFIIPLIQTFGHVEFILKQKKYAHLREVDLYSNVICPSRGETFDIIKSMIDQIIELHPGIERLHIGADEVYQLGQCTLCRERKQIYALENDQLFLQHIAKIVRYIKASYPNIIIMLWDDMLRHMDPKLIQESGLGNDGVELVVWHYRPHIYQAVRPDVWSKYAKAFGSVWGASAFKGATGDSMQLTNVSYHLDNNHEWLKILGDQDTTLKVPGVIVTGWQRYNHFTPLCELLPAALPSLLANLALLDRGLFDLELHTQLSKDLGSDQSTSLIPLDPSPSPNSSDQPPKSKKTIEIQLLKCKEELEEMLMTIFPVFETIYAPRTIHEWKDTFIKPHINRIENVLANH